MLWWPNSFSTFWLRPTAVPEQLVLFQLRKNPQAGTSQPVRHASLTLRPRIKVGQERRAGGVLAEGKKDWEVCRVDSQGARSDWRKDRRECKKSKERKKTEIEMAGGKQKQVVCDGVCVNESAKVQLVKEHLTRCGDKTMKSE